MTGVLKLKGNGYKPIRGHYGCQVKVIFKSFDWLALLEISLLYIGSSPTLYSMFNMLSTF